MYLRHHDVHDRTALGEAIKAAYRDRDGKRPHVESWDRIANISEVEYARTLSAAIFE